MRRIFILLVIVLMLTSCTGPESQPSATPVATPMPTTVRAVPPTPKPTKTEPAPTPTPRPVSYTTGLPYEGSYKPVMAVIENSPAARPQNGLQTADVVYEVPVEGDITRFVCVFSDSVPDEIMPVRSARVPFLYIQGEWDAIFMHFGGSGKEAITRKEDYSVYGNKLYGEMKIVMDGLSGKWNDYFHRDPDNPEPHNVVGNPFLAQSLYNYEPKPLGWLFDANVKYTGEAVPKINLKMCASHMDYVSYQYDEAEGVYQRSMDGKKFLSAETGGQVSVKNVIVLHSTYKTSSGIKLWNLTGSGEADYYIGGQHIKGIWKKDSAASPTLFCDDQGNQIVLRPGNTWIEICPKD